MMSIYCKTCGHHSSMHVFINNKSGCATVNQYGEPYEQPCVCSGFRRKEKTFVDIAKRFAEQKAARKAMVIENKKRKMKRWSGRE